MKQDREYYMQRAIEVANEAKRDGGVAIGAVLVEDETGKVISRGESIVGITHDPTSHAEVNCIRKACEQRETDDLFGCTLYSTLEPCHMCLSAATWARVPNIFFGAFRKDVDASLFDIKGGFSDEREAKRMNLRENMTMYIEGGILEKECAKLLDSYHELHKHDPR